MRMAEDIDLVKLQDLVSGSGSLDGKSPTYYQAMRRKLQVPSEG